MLSGSDQGPNAWDLGDAEAWEFTAWPTSLWPGRSDGWTPSHANAGLRPPVAGVQARALK